MEFLPLYLWWMYLCGSFSFCCSWIQAGPKNVIALIRGWGSPLGVIHFELKFALPVQGSIAAIGMLVGTAVDCCFFLLKGDRWMDVLEWQVPYSVVMFVVCSPQSWTDFVLRVARRLDRHLCSPRYNCTFDLLSSFTCSCEGWCQMLSSCLIPSFHVPMRYKFLNKVHLCCTETFETFSWVTALCLMEFKFAP